MKKLIIIFGLLLVYVIIFQNFTVNYKNTEAKKSIKYNGILWVGLDYWTIWKYKSLDEPIKIIIYTETKITKSYERR